MPKTRDKYINLDGGSCHAGMALYGTAVETLELVQATPSPFFSPLPATDMIGLHSQQDTSASF